MVIANGWTEIWPKGSLIAHMSFYVLYLGALFLEFWKRYSAEVAHRWNVTLYHPEEEHPRPEYIAQLKNVKERTVNFVTQTTEPRVRPER